MSATVCRICGVSIRLVQSASMIDQFAIDVQPSLFGCVQVAPDGIGTVLDEQDAAAARDAGAELFTLHTEDVMSDIDTTTEEEAASSRRLDPELRMIAPSVRLLDDLEPAARIRAVAYLASRYTGQQGDSHAA